jgi:hypothetical protein
MKFKTDIINKVQADFDEYADNAIDILNDALLKIDYLQDDRIVRCIIFLSKGDLNELKKNIEAAIYEPRDIMFWAEYDKVNGKMSQKRLRDFNKSFDKCTLTR